MRKIFTLIIFSFLTLQTYGMNLFVQTPNNGTISLDVEPSDSGENVKNKIFDQISIPVINPDSAELHSVHSYRTNPFVWFI